MTSMSRGVAARMLIIGLVGASPAVAKAQPPRASSMPEVPTEDAAKVEKNRITFFLPLPTPRAKDSQQSPGYYTWRIIVETSQSFSIVVTSDTALRVTDPASILKASRVRLCADPLVSSALACASPIAATLEVESNQFRVIVRDAELLSRLERERHSAPMKFAFSVALGLLCAPVAQAQLTPELQRIFGRPVAVGEAVEFGTPLSYALYDDGSLAIVEDKRYDVTRIAPDGRIVWRSGRQGKGPGEFTIPYRVVVLQDQSILVHDLAKPGWSHIDANGKYIGEVDPDIKVRIDDVEALPTGQVVIVGITADPRGKGRAIHVLTPRLQHVRSFGRLPETKDPRTLQSFGAGGLSVTADGQILHTRMYPYEISKYTVDGFETARLRMKPRVATPEDYVYIDVYERRVTRVINPSALRPIPAKDLGNGQFIGGRLAKQELTVDLIGDKGDIVSSGTFPVGWEYIAAIDYKRRVFWVTGESDDVPVKWRVPFGAALPQR